MHKSVKKKGNRLSYICAAGLMQLNVWLSSLKLTIDLIQKITKPGLMLEIYKEWQALCYAPSQALTSVFNIYYK